MRYWSFCVLLLSCNAFVQGQVSYNDVGVIVNSNSPVSLAIGAYFQAARNIPAINIIPVDTPLDETIGFDEFDSIRVQIEDYLIANDLVNSLNYLVTTKGFPLRVEVSDCDTLNQFTKCAAIDSELALLLGPLEGSIQTIGSVANPYLSSTAHHQRAEDGIYLVTRLDALTQSDVLDLIDRSGADLPIDRSTAQLVGDVSNFNNPDIFNFLVQQVGEMLAPMAAQGWNTYVEATDAMLPPTSDVAIYIGEDSLHANGIPELHWTPGGFGFAWTVNSAESFDPAAALPVHKRTAWLISSGATGARGNVAPVYGSMNYYTHISLQRYLDTTYQFNLAESAYAGIPKLSWMYQVIGDPKTSIAWSSPAGLQDLPIANDVILMPNPSSGSFYVRIPTETVARVMIHDAIGRSIPFVSRSITDRLQVDLMGGNPGLYHVRVLTSSGRTLTGRLVLQP